MARGDAFVAQDARLLFYILFGCQPGAGVDANTMMVEDLSNIFESKLEVENYSFVIPESFQETTGTDANFEISQSNTLIPISIFYRFNVVLRNVGVIFRCNVPITDKLKVIYQNKIEVGDENDKILLDKVQLFLQDCLQLDEIHPFFNLSKGQLVEKFDWLAMKSRRFEK